jgi:2-polyprenyl-3-methyl-5-hydroxy-6-metoxy-1,4-benzoquinol methylase
LLPNLSEKSVLDLGLWMALPRYARQHGAHRVFGVDLSEKMLARAKAQPNNGGIEYKQCAIEDLDVGNEQFDVVISSLRTHSESVVATRSQSSLTVSR